MLPNEAVKLNKLPNVEIMEHIQNWFKELNRNNRDYIDYLETDQSKTQRAYESDLRLFLHVVRKKDKGSELEYLNYNDLEFTFEDFEKFKQYLFDAVNDEGKNKYTNKTINRKVSAIKNFVRYLSKKKLIKDISYLELVNAEKERDNHYGVLSVSEVFDFANWAWKHERELGEVKRNMILFSLDTCIRKSALLRLKWSDFTIREDGVMVKGIDKGNSDFRQLISIDFYNEMLKIKDEKSDKVFNVSEKVIDSMMARYRKFFNIPKERLIVWHSIRKSGVSFRYRVTGDILEAKRAARHKNINTTMIYLEEEDYGALGAVSSTGKLNENLYREVERDILNEAISKCPKDMQYILNLRLNEVLKQK